MTQAPETNTLEPRIDEDALLRAVDQLAEVKPAGT
jgi:hypothetical protein